MLFSHQLIQSQILLVKKSTQSVTKIQINRRLEIELIVWVHQTFKTPKLEKVLINYKIGKRTLWIQTLHRLSHAY
jgi:hypothetical protein